jgi:hypothetical protein
VLTLCAGPAATRTLERLTPAKVAAILSSPSTNAKRALVSKGEQPLRLLATRLSLVGSRWVDVARIYAIDNGDAQRYICKTNRMRDVRSKPRAALVVREFDAETSFYKHFAAQIEQPRIPPDPQRPDSPCAAEIPKLKYVHANRHGTLLCTTLTPGVDAHGEAGVPRREISVAALRWLARFHGTFWQMAGKRTAAWDKMPANGSFWDLDSRSWGKVRKLPWNNRLMRAARAFDTWLEHDPMQTMLHGDFKLLNLRFHDVGAAANPGKADGRYVGSAFDFQFAGRGSPTKDLADWFKASTPSNETVADLLAVYRDELARCLTHRGIEPPSLSWLSTSLEVATADIARYTMTSTRAHSTGRKMYDWLEERLVRKVEELDRGKLLDEAGAYERAAFQRWPSPGHQAPLPD